MIVVPVAIIFGPVIVILPLVNEVVATILPPVTLPVALTNPPVRILAPVMLPPVMVPDVDITFDPSVARLELVYPAGNPVNCDPLPIM